MAVETLAGPYTNVVGPGHGLSGDIKAAFGYYDFGTVVIEDGDIRTLFKLPPRCIVIGGWMMMGDGDTGTETLDFDLGWTANGGGSETYTDSRSGITYTNAGSVADANGFFAGGVLTGDALVGAAGSNFRPVTLQAGPLYFSRETQVQFEVNAPAATPAAFLATAVLLYVMV